jgi:hypothetical protein
VDIDAYRGVVATESRRVLDVLGEVEPGAVVPSCRGWHAEDLLWHLAEVHAFWAQVAGRLLLDPSDADDLERPAELAALRALAATARTDLLDALAARAPSDRCWSWSDLGGDVGWVARRQAHEALIHRVDAELTAGAPVQSADADLAADGVQEIVEEFICGVPAWATWTSGDARVALSCTDAEQRHVVELGRMAGTSPDSGRRYDLPAGRRIEVPGTDVDVEVGGAAWDLDRWLWGRGPRTALSGSGDAGVLDRFRELVTDATQ